MQSSKEQPALRISAGKYKNITALTNARGIFTALAMDQRGSLRRLIASVSGKAESDAELSEFKAVVAEVLTNYASAILLDPEFGLDAVRCRSPKAGVLLAYEKSGYDKSARGRQPGLLPHWSVRRLVSAGAQGIKIVIYYDPDEDTSINTTKQIFIERVGAECRAEDVPFFLELISYDDTIGDEKSIEFARVKPGKVIRSIQEFSKPEYGADILKVEVPINMRYVEGSIANGDGHNAYSRKDARAYFKQMADSIGKPFIYLSAGVTDAVFRETLELAAEAETPFSGVLCGRATWQDGVAVYAKGGAGALRDWLKERGVQNITTLNKVLETCARPWWDFYGGKDKIEVVGGK